MNATSSFPVGLQAVLVLAVAVLAILAVILFRVRGRYRAAVNGRKLVDSALLRRGISSDEILSSETAHAVDEARARCSHCGMQRACLGQVASGGGGTPDACPNRSLFDRLADRVRRPAMRRFRLESHTPVKH